MKATVIRQESEDGYHTVFSHENMNATRKPLLSPIHKRDKGRKKENNIWEIETSDNI
jgi:hypothetical protein